MSCVMTYSKDLDMKNTVDCELLGIMNSTHFMKMSKNKVAKLSGSVIMRLSEV